MSTDYCKRCGLFPAATKTSTGEPFLCKECDSTLTKGPFAQSLASTDTEWEKYAGPSSYYAEIPTSTSNYCTPITPEWKYSAAPAPGGLASGVSDPDLNYSVNKHRAAPGSYPAAPASASKYTPLTTSAADPSNSTAATTKADASTSTSDLSSSYMCSICKYTPVWTSGAKCSDCKSFTDFATNLLPDPLTSLCVICQKTRVWPDGQTCEACIKAYVSGS
ncbi:hypothetical protein B0T26DRAFT_682674 [Lasiosphaeria miniovina]|uniref:Uncharacterized protein n=1 Tax=Lasiosphaeria miniovina TaxID=1954250 RepID=A0AA40ED49_9PEZI|nr:uncharacterized protein B0T26DRAFT_682674 [Lasiosphaeria miniovina]KAK0733041.1 hypothetical protein B0T26DRAFT_682674 [Lasiosphaeria miniovina]